MNLVATQLNFSAKVKPRGQILVNWRAFLESEVEKEDTLMWARREEEMKLVGEIPADMKPFQVRFIEGLRSVIP